jgi:radical SAM protein with 4Fe4S-binding SPASM domain
MTNIALTSVCNRSCDYCFAEPMGQEPSLRFMTHTIFEHSLDFIDRSGIDEIRLLGGEPTLHPEFVPFLDYALARRKPIRIFSNGVMPEAVLRFAETLPANKVSFLINVSASLADLVAHQELKVVLGRLGQRVTIGLNISRPWSKLAPPGTDDEIGYVLDLIDRHQLERNLRIGMAHPCIGRNNSFLHPNHYAVAGYKILDLARRALHRSVRLSLDCGFVPCMAPGLLDSAFGEMSRNVCGNCGPVLDILPDGRVIPCFPLALVVSARLEDYENAASLRSHFESILSQYRDLGEKIACARCDFRKKNACSGGCLASAMKRLATPNFQLRI